MGTVYLKLKREGRGKGRGVFYVYIYLFINTGCNNENGAEDRYDMGALLVGKVKQKGKESHVFEKRVLNQNSRCALCLFLIGG